MTIRELVWVTAVVGMGSLACQPAQQRLSRHEDALTVARGFIAATLKGDKKTASQYIIADTQNLRVLDQWHSRYQQFAPAKKVTFAQASILILKDSIANDSTQIIVFTHAFDRITRQVMLVRRGQTYRVDVKGSWMKRRDAAS